jgi:hypothetical protein
MMSVSSRNRNSTARPAPGDYLKFAAGVPAFMLLDHDAKGMPQGIAAKLNEVGGFWQAIESTVSALSCAARVVRPSTSSGLFRPDTGERFGGSQNVHVYVAVADGTDIERALKTLHDRLWLAGLGYFVVGAAGQLLDRSIIDAAVFGPERLVFEGAPVIEPPLAQDAELRRPQPFKGDVIDTEKAIPPLTAGEQKQLVEIKTAAAYRLKPDADKARKAWTTEYARKRGLSEDEAARIVVEAVDRRSLAPAFLLEFDDLGTCTVADVLAEPDKFVGETLADPIEGIGYGRGKAKVLRRDNGSVLIHSFAHGGIKYDLPTPIQELIDELARLDPIDYDRRRNEAADQMGIRRSTLDDQVDARRAEQADEAGTPPLLGHWVVEPWSEPVDTSELILALVGRVKRHVILSDDEALAVALWIMFAWVHDAAAVHSPILLATSAEANSGKTQLLSLIGFLAPRALVCVEISEATLYRSIEKWQPTIIVDEADVILINNEPLRSVVNSGWTRGSCVPRCIGDDNTPHAFSTFCPKAIGMKGRKLPDTTLSRSIIIEMKRKKLGESVRHFRSIDDAGLAELRRRALRWANDNGEELDGTEPVMPVGFDNRLGDNWLLLLAIADKAGGEWPAKARKAAIRLSEVVEATSIGTQLLAAIKVIFLGAGEEGDADKPLFDQMSSEDLAAALGDDKTGPWAEWKNGKPITQAQLARVLSPFGIRPDVIWSKGRSIRGYRRAWFEDAWERYLPQE